MSRPRNFNKSQALKSAMHVFWQKGYDATKIPDLLAATGLSRSSLYETFGDKQSLFEASITEYLCSIGHERLVALRRGQTAREGLTLFFDHLIATCLDKSIPGGCLMVNTSTALDSHNQKVKKIVNESMRSFHQVFLALLERAQYSKEISSDKNIQDLSHMLVAVSAGINVVARTEVEKSTLQTMADSAINLIFS